MYTKIKNVQILISLLKQHGIRHLVLSAGTRHVPLAHSVENDPYFICYSVVDERSAGYYAIGLAKELGVPVAIACTSSTATCNYTPAVAEAYYQKVPLLVLTGDRDPYRLNQLEDQMINQVDMYKNFCKKCVNLPIVDNEYDEWYCQRLINEAILELTHRGGGPVQINFPINQPIEDIADASVPVLPIYNKITRISYNSTNDVWQQKIDELKKRQRVLVLCGSNPPIDKNTENAMEQFCEKFNCVIATEPLSNIHCKGSLDTYVLAESITGKHLAQMAPDTIVFFGGNFMSRFKILLRGMKTCDTWFITEDGAIVDPFQNLSTIFECSPQYFFNYFASNSGNIRNNKLLYNDFKILIDKIPAVDFKKLPLLVNDFMKKDALFKKHTLPESELLPENYLSSIYAFHEFSKRIPKGSLVHLSILNSTRIMSLFLTDPSLSVYSNLGTDGIDGSMSTFLGQAAASNRPCYLVIGDLSFFYDMNSLTIRNIKPNVHILLINNGGGAEFYFSMGPKLLPNIDLHIAASHNKSARQWVLDNNFDYLSASNLLEFDQNINRFVNANKDKPILFEIFTNKEFDMKSFKTYRRLINQGTAVEKLGKQMESIPIVKKAIETPVGQKLKTIIKQQLKKHF